MTCKNYRENFLRAATFSEPEYIPCRIYIFWPVWNIYREKLLKTAKRYPHIFGSVPDRFDEGEPGIPLVDEYKQDAFGCVWRTRIKGYIGEVVKHPLNDWSNFENFRLPDPEAGLPTESGEPTAIIPWDKVFSELEKARERGELVVASLPHGFLLQRLYYLRSLPKLLVDMYRGDPRLERLIDMLTDYWISIIRIYKRNLSRIDVFSFGDDLGAQKGPMIRLEHFKRYILPSYRKIFSEARSAGALIRLHTDGDIMALSDLLMETDVNILNIQDRVNGIDRIAEKFKGKICVDLDIDRQHLIPYGKPNEIKEYIKNVVEALNTPKGGLMLYAEVHPPTPLENIIALAEAFNEIMRGCS